MSLHPEQIGEVPEETARVAKACFPKGNRSIRLRDSLGTIFADHEFADLFPRKGQPAEAPWRLALVCLVQYMEELTDRQAADAVRSRMDIKYLLGLELTDPGFDCSVLSEFRTRLVEHQAEYRLFELLVAKLSEQGYLKKRGSLRTDSTHMSFRSASIPSGRTIAGNAARRPECRWLPRLPGSNETPVV